MKEKTGRLILARTGWGKSRCIIIRRERTFVFASELKPIMKFPVPESNQPPDGGEILCSKYIEAPLVGF